jgi:hypothetical protein
MSAAAFVIPILLVLADERRGTISLLSNRSVVSRVLTRSVAVSELSRSELISSESPNT